MLLTDPLITFFSKLILTKAYDRVEWDFVLQYLFDIRLGKRFIKVVHALLGMPKLIYLLMVSLLALSLWGGLSRRVALLPPSYSLLMTLLGGW